jgi:hypothetical protein
VLWSGLAGTLGELERLAGEPARLDDADALAALRRLQYRLHIASEAAYGFAPPSGVEPVHAELAAALAGARDATADLADALEEDGFDSALQQLHEWRGALFRVRLARLRLVPPSRSRTPVPRPRRTPPTRKALVACLLVTAGAIAFASGAVVGEWPLWTAGLLAVAGALLAYKP